MSLVIQNYFSLIAESRGFKKVEINIDKLDNDSLIHIFKFLSIKEKQIVRRVCKRWKNLLRKSWSTVNHLNVSRLIRQNILNNFSHHVNKDNLSFFRDILYNCGPYLRSIEVVFSDDLDDIYEHEFRKFNLPTIGKLCPNLEIIDIRSSHTVMYYEVKALAVHCKNIKVLKLLDTNKKSDPGKYIETFDYDMFMLLQVNIKLRSLHLKFIYFKHAIFFSNLTYLIENINVSLNGNFKNSLATNLPNYKNLVSFKMNFVLNIHIDDLKDILRSLQSCHNLVNLTLDLHFVYDDCIEELLSELFKKTSIKSFRLENGNITGKCLLDLKEDVIESLKFENCRYIDYSNLLICLSHFKKLRVLKFIYLSYINDSTIKKFKSLQDLEYLCLWNTHHQLACSSINSILSLKNLKTLKLMAILLVDDVYLRMIANQLKNLSYLDIRFCININDEGVKYLCQLPDLKFLKISYIEHLTGEGLLNFKKLTGLECIDCDIMKKYMIQVIQNCENLQWLDISQCRRINEDFIERTMKLTKKRTNDKLLTLNVNKCKINLDSLINNSQYLQIITADTFEVKPFKIE